MHSFTTILYRRNADLPVRVFYSVEQSAETDQQIEITIDRVVYCDREITITFAESDRLVNDAHNHFSKT